MKLMMIFKIKTFNNNKNIMAKITKKLFRFLKKQK